MGCYKPWSTPPSTSETLTVQLRQGEKEGSKRRPQGITVVSLGFLWLAKGWLMSHYLGFVVNIA